MAPSHGIMGPEDLGRERLIDHVRNIPTQGPIVLADVDRRPRSRVRVLEHGTARKHGDVSCGSTTKGLGARVRSITIARTRTGRMTPSTCPGAIESDNSLNHLKLSLLQL